MNPAAPPPPRAVDADAAADPYGNAFLLADVGRQYMGVVTWSLTADAPLPARLAQLAQQVKAYFIDLTESGTQSFSNHFARLTYVAQTAKLDPRLSYFLHQFDREASKSLRGEEVRLDPETCLLLGAKALGDAIVGVTKLEPPALWAELLPDSYDAFQLQGYRVAEYKTQLRALVVEDLEAQQVLRVRLVDSPGLDHYVHYARPGYNERFVGPAVALLRRYYTWPVEVNLLHVEVDQSGELNPQHLIIDPDFLVDVTAVAKCFDVEGAEPVKYLLGRVTPFTSSVPVLAGNVANHFLDSALIDCGDDFVDSFRKTFAAYPLEYAKLTDDEVRKLMEACANHFKVIAEAVVKHLPAEGIACEDCVVEPSFYAERYGLQGRLDAFRPPVRGDANAAIVELKSGSIFRPNQHQIVQEHYVQTLLYDLLVKAVFGEKTKPRNFVLYSRDRERPLRYAPINRSQQFDALAVRNKMMAIERLLGESRPGAECPLDWLRPERYPNMSGFVQRDLQGFHASWSTLSDLERDYIRAFVGFIAREQRLAKVGAQSNDRITGQAALWREDLEVKVEGYAILHDLNLVAVAQKEGFPVLSFRRTTQADGQAALTSFRRGDIVVLYPGDAARRAVLHHQVFKGTITRLTNETVEVRLRATQPDLTRFQQHDRFNVEPDLFDSSFTRLYQNLAEFASAKPETRELVLGLRPPIQAGTQRVRRPARLTKEQADIFEAIVNAREYYLLWGPPGTGKTSMMLHHLCEHFVNSTRERILVLAFTNRAVDEICSAIEQIGGDITKKYIRIGSSFGCAEEFGRQLLQGRMGHLQTRQQIRDLLDGQRIVVGTVSAVSGKGESLFDLLQFDRVIIDEASQLLEPSLVSLMARFPRTILIGDHRQLPAVVTQSERNTRVDDSALRAIGLTDLRNSLFERLFHRCESQGWHWACGQLTRQGRLHATLATYVNDTFYGGSLKNLGQLPPSADWQMLTNAWEKRPDDCSDLEHVFCDHSYVFVDTPVDLSDKAFRTNLHEAEAVVTCIRSLVRLQRCKPSTLYPKQLGIITPYRAQIARIRQAIQVSDLPQEWSEVTIDTVERYQGSTYDYILLSLCANQGSNVARLSSKSAESDIDRKLNVALTRARLRVIGFGNVELLRGYNDAYCKFIDYCAAGGSLWGG